MPFPKTEANSLADTCYEYPATRTLLPPPKKHPWPEILPDGPAGPDPAAYRLPEFQVCGRIAGRTVRLNLSLQEDVTVHEVVLLMWLMAGKVKGNLLACVIDEGLVRHFVEVEEEEPEPGPVTVNREQMARAAQAMTQAEKHGDVLRYGAVASRVEQAEAKRLMEAAFEEGLERQRTRQALRDMKDEQARRDNPQSLTMQVLREAMELIPGVKREPR